MVLFVADLIRTQGKRTPFNPPIAQFIAAGDS
jgi:hypothetical protein